MPAIGYVRPTNKGYQGHLKTLSIKAPVQLVKTSSKEHDNSPDYIVYAGEVEVGAGWTKRGKQSGEDYVSLTLAAPEFGSQKLYANLGRAAGQDDDDLYAIIWNPK